MPQARATKAIKQITNALKASARRKPSSALSEPCSRMFAASLTARMATEAKANRFMRSHVARERVTRQSRLASSGRRGRRIMTIIESSSIFASHNTRRPSQQFQHRRGQPDAEEEQASQQEGHRGYAVPPVEIVVVPRAPFAQQDASELLQHAAERRDERYQHEQAHHHSARRNAAAQDGQVTIEQPQ